MSRGTAVALAVAACSCAAAQPPPRAARAVELTASARSEGPAATLATPPELERSEGVPRAAAPLAFSLTNGVRGAVISRRDARLVAVTIDLLVPPSTSMGVRSLFAATLLRGRNPLHAGVLERWLSAHGVSVDRGQTLEGVRLDIAIPADLVGRALELIGRELREYDVSAESLGWSRELLAFDLAPPSEPNVLDVARRRALAAAYPGTALATAPAALVVELRKVERPDLLRVAQSVLVGPRVRVVLDGPVSVDAAEVAVRGAFGNYPTSDTVQARWPAFAPGSVLVTEERAAEAAVAVTVRVPTPHGSGAARLCAQAWNDALFTHLRVRRGESYVTEVTVAPFGPHADVTAWTASRAGAGPRSLSTMMAELARVSATKCGDAARVWADLERHRAALSESALHTSSHLALDGLRAGEAEVARPSAADVELVAASLDRDHAVASVVDKGASVRDALELDGWRLLP